MIFEMRYCLAGSLQIIAATAWNPQRAFSVKNSSVMKMSPQLPSQRGQRAAKYLPQRSAITGAEWRDGGGALAQVGNQVTKALI
jgi:hypothetical protein